MFALVKRPKSFYVVVVVVAPCQCNAWEIGGIKLYVSVIVATVC